MKTVMNGVLTSRPVAGAKECGYFWVKDAFGKWDGVFRKVGESTKRAQVCQARC